jgi:hypothetical protein
MEPASLRVFTSPYIKEARRYKLRGEIAWSRLVAELELRREFVNLLCFSDGATMALPAHCLPKHRLNKRKQGSIKGAPKTGERTRWERGRSLRVQKQGKH